MGLGEDLDATLTNEGASDADNTVCEETVRDKQITAYRAGLGSSPCIQDEFFGVEDTTNDEALAGVMAENYADEEEEDRLLKNCSKFVFLQNLIICFLVCLFMTAMTGDKGGGHT